MKCSHCKDVELTQVLTTAGVVVDYCSQCEGMWLDKNEIYYFTKAPTYLYHKLEEALANPKPSSRVNPHTQEPLIVLSLFGGVLEIDYCPKSGGIWLDKGELDKLPGAKGTKLKIRLDKRIRAEPAIRKTTAVALPNLGFASTMTLFFLYAMLTLALIILVNFGFLTPAAALFFGIIFAALQFLLSPFITDLTLRWLYNVKWVELKQLPPELAGFITTTCTKNNMKVPRMGVIPDGSPNAFTYGHTPNNARIVITSGIMDLLQARELEAVVAHEIGHAVHWDMLIMTVANLVPLIFYYIYRTLIRMRSRGRDKSAPYRYAIAAASYILYIISEYIVLWFSRIREYFADRFAGETTGNPNSLAEALVKIGYGLAGRDKKKEKRKGELDSMKAMGIFDSTSARALAISGHHPRSLGGEVDKETLKGAMRWDFWNPWAMYYELHSTHPLIAKRLRALSAQSESYGREPYIIFDERRPESYWDEFIIDLVISSLPLLSVIVSAILFALTQQVFYIKFGLFLLGGTYLLLLSFSYNFQLFPEMSIASLLKKVKVSKVRPVPCTIRGTIVGRGVPGLIFSEDFVLQDESGIIFLDYQQPLAIWNFFFGLLRAKQYIGEDAEIKGWYRRAPVPYIEIKELITSRGKSTCFVFNVKMVVAIGLIIMGIASFLFMN